MSNYFKRCLSCFMTLALIFTLLPAFSLPVQAATGTVNVDWDTEYQTHDGVGGAFAFNKGHALLQIEEFDPDLAEKLWDLLFSEENGVGFDIVRTIIGDGGVSTASTKAQTWGSRFYDGASDTIEPEEGKWVWEQSDWAEVKEHWDAGQVRAMQEAWKNGVRTFYIDAWTAPYWMKANNSILGGKIKTDTDSSLPAGANKKYYKAYADYLVQNVLFYKREFGIEITHVGPTNESDGSNTSYSQMSLNATELTDLYVNYCIPAFEKARDDGLFDDFAQLPSLAGPEGTNFSASINTYGSVMNNANVYGSEMYNTFTTHVYGSAPSAPLTAGSSNHPTWLRNYEHIWQSEYMDRSNSSGSNDATQTYANEGITDGVKWANLITNLFSSDPGYTGYLNWWLIGTNGADGSDLIRLCTTGSPQNAGGGTLTGEYKTFKRFYTIGHYSRFLDNGYVRIGATRVPVSGVNTIAYKNPADDDFTINLTSTGANTLTFNLNDFPYDVESVTIFRTSASENMRKVGEIAVTGDSFVLDVPANSVTTIVPSGKPKSELDGLDYERDIFSTLEAERDDSGIDHDLNAAGTAVEMKNGDALVFENINFQEGSANGGIVRRHLLFMQPVGTRGSGGIMEARIGSETGPIVAEWVIAGGSGSIPASNYLVDTGELGAYGHKDLYIVARGDDESGVLFSIDRMEFGDNGNASTAYTYPSNAVSNPGFGTNTTGWTADATGVTLTRSTNQNYADFAISGSTTNGYGMLVTRTAAAADRGVYTALTASALTVGQRYRLIGMVMPDAVNTSNTDNNKLSQLEHKAEAYIVYMNGSTEIGRELITEREGLTRLPMRHSGGASGVARPGATTPYGPYDYDPYEWCPPGWFELTGTITYNPPAGTTAARLLVTVDGDRMFALDEVRLQPAVDKTALIDAVNAASGIASAVPAFTEALSAAKAMILNTSVIQAQVNTAAANLEEAIGNYVNTGSLAEYIAFAETVTGDAYTAGSFAVFTTALDNAKAVLANEESTQADVDSALAALKQAYEDLESKPLVVLSVDNSMILPDEYFNVSATFDNEVASNAIQLIYTYDASKFEYRGFTPAEGWTSTRIVDDSENGILSIIIANTNAYSAEQLGSVNFSATKDGIDQNEEIGISLNVNYVTAFDGVKSIDTAEASLDLLVSIGLGDVTLIDLSNIIDLFGTTSEDANWTVARFYDFNGNGEIDIEDITYIASKL